MPCYRFDPLVRITDGGVHIDADWDPTSKANS